MSALSVLELSDLKLLNNAVLSAMNKKESEMTRSKIGAAAAKMTPVFFPRKLKDHWTAIIGTGLESLERTNMMPHLKPSKQ